MLVINYAIDMNSWISDLQAKRNAIQSKQELERALLERRGIEALELAVQRAEIDGGLPGGWAQHKKDKCK